MNMTVEIPNDFWIRGNQVTAELQGDLSVRRGKEGLLVLGTLKTIRGDFKLYYNSFRISKGEFRFSDVKSFWNAYIELEAGATVLDERIQITAVGYIDELDITATSESGWNEQQIFEALLLRRADVSETGEEPGFVSQAFVRSWATALANQVSDDVARELHLDRFGVEIGESVEEDALSATRFTFGKYVSDRVYLEYSQSLGSLYGDRRKFTQTGLSYPERQISVEYRLSDKFSIEGETGTIGGLGYFEVDLKLRYGY
jgi:autotransporter translocation and assembly factor TamB